MANKRYARIGPHHAPPDKFTGAKGSDSKKRRKSSRKSRKLRRGTHVNKYADQ